MGNSEPSSQQLRKRYERKRLISQTKEKLYQVLDYDNNQMKFERVLDDNNSFQKQIYKNINQWKKLQHINIMKLDNYFELQQQKINRIHLIIGQQPNSYKPISELAPDTTQIISIYKQLLNAIYYLQMKPIKLSMMKLSNIYSNQKFEIKIYPLGPVQSYNRKHRKFTPEEQYYRAPQLNQNVPTIKSNLFALGIIIFQLFTRKPISNYLQKSPQSYDSSLKQIVQQLKIPIELQGIMRIMLNSNPSQRIITGTGITDIVTFLKFKPQKVIVNNISRLSLRKSLLIQSVAIQIIKEPNKFHKNQEIWSIQDYVELFIILAYNQIEDKGIVSISKRLTKLQVLWVGHNKISDEGLLQISTNLTNLKILNLEYNKIRQIQCLQKIKSSSLEKLQLSGNLIQDVMSLNKLPLGLKQLGLANNKIESVRQMIKINLPKLKQIWLNRNKWNNIYVEYDLKKLLYLSLPKYCQINF